jgi:pimeloyl-ACP methyl ester carboxylesterase
MEMIEVDGLNIAYERRQIEGLSDEFMVVAWDAPGAGRSSDPPEWFGMAGYADCLAGFVERLGLEKPHVAGLSFGGALALELYRRHSPNPDDADTGVRIRRMGWLSACRRR